MNASKEDRKISNKKMQRAILLIMALKDYIRNQGEDENKPYPDFKGNISDDIRNKTIEVCCTLKNLENLVNSYVKNSICSQESQDFCKNYPDISNDFQKETVIKSLGDVIKDADEHKLLKDDRHKSTRQGSKDWRFTVNNIVISESNDETIKSLKERYENEFFGNSNSFINSNIFEPPLEFQTLIKYHTDPEDFIERKDIIERFKKFQKDHSQGYFILQGDPGVGKTAILAKYVLENKCPCFFVQQPQGLNQIYDFLESICNQLYHKYYDQLRHFKEKLENVDISLLNSLLEEISKKVLHKHKSQLVIVIDALDEVYLSNESENILKLPEYLPEGIFFFMSQRPKNIFLEIEVPLMIEDISCLIGDTWKEDCRTYIKKYLDRREKLRTSQDDKTCSEERLFESEEKLIETLTLKSQRNFRYLKNVLVDIERGVYKNLDSLDNLPEGLRGYYESHLRRMNINHKSDIRHKRLLRKLANASSGHVSLISFTDMVSLFESQYELQLILEEWKQFLYKQEVDGKLHYRLYHPSFSYFLQNSDLLRFLQD
ncbi:hypothetical protein VF14_14260 [Nostoc linckia z18]|uniref:Nephrocystin 3-like N-terminal domain-containing protein n=2 Tax=Nostoc linckia TaxID=92942 RepID=A0A9Q6EL54_NOSLI|nr:AAA family ATPase [Nostoc linckia]PHK40586.1 hypothetical protein VF12_10030 [Nostoc linckia z15]PHK46748.1 hypothetical protein VF13_09365 [Nostoc linckia z16]PHJ60716.1 hypothetical protein VF02_21925 [Nostoc linckia z1]PHJ62227.1 hypothetical protein VF05_27260 [Nostoc linckia z3]PHJ71477.1 hypothetical protein VF03_20350 [Nostoc linckia z2]